MLPLINSTLAPYHDHNETVRLWEETFAECKSKSALSRRINKAITEMTEHLSDVRDAVEKRSLSGAWLHGMRHNHRHVTLLERELVYLLQKKENLKSSLN